MKNYPSIWIKGTLLLPVLLCLPPSSQGDDGRHPWRGLWIGEASLDRATRVVSVVGDNNVRDDPDHNAAEPERTADRANIRLILHVNAAGQARLLKGVAILDRTPNLLDRKDIALVTDASLYPDFDDQFARRIASAAFDFGEVQAVNLIDEIIEVSASAASTAAAPAGASLAGIQQATTNALTSLAAASDVNKRFIDFLTKSFDDPGNVIEPADFDAVVNAAVTEASAAAFAAAPDTLENIRLAVDAVMATNTMLSGGLKAAGVDDWPDGGGAREGIDGILGLKGQAVFQDSRGIEAVEAVISAAVATASEAAFAGASEADILAAASLAVEIVLDAAIDIEGAYNNFIASQAFLDLERFAAEAATREALNQSGDADAIATALREGDYALLKAVGPAGPEQPDPGAGIRAVAATASVLKANSRLADDRANVAVREVLEAVVLAVSGPAAEGQSETAIREAADLAAAAAVEGVTPGLVSTSTPSHGYNQYLLSDEFATALSIAGSTAAEKANDLKGTAGIESEVILAVSNALRTQQSQAARVPLNQVTLEGSFEPGKFVAGTIVLPANHPTNPFRHRRHNLNTTGFDIERKVRLTFRTEEDGSETNSEIRPVGRGLHRVEGIYEEEVFGLHKNLGDAVTPKGLRVKGKFTLHRVSLVDALNVTVSGE